MYFILYMYFYFKFQDHGPRRSVPRRKSSSPGRLHGGISVCNRCPPTRRCFQQVHARISFTQQFIGIPPLPDDYYGLDLGDDDGTCTQWRRQLRLFRRWYCPCRTKAGKAKGRQAHAKAEKSTAHHSANFHNHCNFGYHFTRL